MSRVKLTAKNVCHTPVVGGERVEALITQAAKGCLDDYLASGGDLNVASDNGITALHALARSKSGSKTDQAALAALLAAGCDTNLTNFRGETALMRAVSTGVVWMVAPLLSAGARIDVRDKKGRSVMEMADPQNDEIMALLSARELEGSVAPCTSRTPSRRM